MIWNDFSSATRKNSDAADDVSSALRAFDGRRLFPLPFSLARKRDVDGGAVGWAVSD